MAKKHSVLKFIAASTLAAVFAAATASFFRKRREKAMIDEFDDFDDFDDIREPVSASEDAEKDTLSGEASEDYEAWDSAEEAPASSGGDNEQ